MLRLFSKNHETLVIQYSSNLSIGNGGKHCEETIIGTAEELFIAVGNVN